MFLTFKGITYNGKEIVSNSIIQKEMPDGLHILLAINGKWIRIKQESFRCLELQNLEMKINVLSKISYSLAENKI